MLPSMMLYYHHVVLQEIEAKLERRLRVRLERFSWLIATIGRKKIRHESFEGAVLSSATSSHVFLNPNFFLGYLLVFQ